MKEENYRVIKLRPQRIRGQVDRWVFGRDCGFYRDWYYAIDRDRKKLTDKPVHWLDQH